MEGNSTINHPSLKNIIESVKAISQLPPQESRLVLRVLISSCDENNIQTLRRLLGQTTKSGFDFISALPAEVSSLVFLFLDGRDLLRCRDVCRPWRDMIKGNEGLWREHIRMLNPAESYLFKVYRQCSVQMLNDQIASISINDVDDAEKSSNTATEIPTAAEKGDIDTNSHMEEVALTNLDATLDRIAKQPGFIGWEEALVQELELKQNWKRGYYAYEVTITFSRDVKPVILSWPYLILVESPPRLYKISLKRLRQDKQDEIEIGDHEKRHVREMDIRSHGAVCCIAWDSSLFNFGEEEEDDETDGESDGDNGGIVNFSEYNIAVGGFLRSVLMCDIKNCASVLLPDIHHSFPLHLCYMRNQIVSITLDGLVTFFGKKDHAPQFSHHINTKVLQVELVDFGPKKFKRKGSGDGEDIIWSEALCLGHDYGVIILDETSRMLCRIDLEVGSKLIQFQAIADETLPRRSEILILYEEPTVRRRHILRAVLAPGFEFEHSSLILRPRVSLSRGGDARESIAMYRDRIAIVSHRDCSSGLGHYCMLKVLDIRENTVFSTEYPVDGEGKRHSEEETGDRNNEETEIGHVQKRSKPIHLDDFAGQKVACRILAMDHARIVIGMGLRTIKVFYMV